MNAISGAVLLRIIKDYFTIEDITTFIQTCKLFYDKQQDMYDNITKLRCIDKDSSFIYHAIQRCNKITHIDYNDHLVPYGHDGVDDDDVDDGVDDGRDDGVDDGRDDGRYDGRDDGNDIYDRLTDADILSHCTSLKTFNAVGCLTLTDDGIATIVQQCHGLTHLNLSFCTQLTLIDIFKNCKHECKLSHLFLTYCSKLTDESIKSLAKNCEFLSQLDVSYCHALTSDSMQYIATWKHLTHLYVSCWMDIIFNGIVTDDSIRLLLLGCPALHTIDMSGCGFVTDASIAIIKTALVVHPRLTYIDVSLCDVSATAIHALQQKWPAIVVKVDKTIHDCPLME
jgi:hypothetical protein